MEKECVSNVCAIQLWGFSSRMCYIWEYYGTYAETERLNLWKNVKNNDGAMKIQLISSFFVTGDGTTKEFSAH